MRVFRFSRGMKRTARGENGKYNKINDDEEKKRKKKKKKKTILNIRSRPV